eukprot:366387-Chlamydomonas_euryale.AAC.35
MPPDLCAAQMPARQVRSHSPLCVTPALPCHPDHPCASLHGACAALSSDAGHPCITPALLLSPQPPQGVCMPAWRLGCSAGVSFRTPRSLLDSDRVVRGAVARGEGPMPRLVGRRHMEGVRGGRAGVAAEPWNNELEASKGRQVEAVGRRHMEAARGGRAGLEASKGRQAEAVGRRHMEAACGGRAGVAAEPCNLGTTSCGQAARACCRQPCVRFHAAGQCKRRSTCLRVCASRLARQTSVRNLRGPRISQCVRTLNLPRTQLLATPASACDISTRHACLDAWMRLRPGAVGTRNCVSAQTRCAAAVVQHRTAQHRTAPHCTAQHCTAQHRTAQHCTAQHCTAQHCMQCLHA